MKFCILKVSIVAANILTLCSCATNPGGPNNQTLGTILGAGGGAAAGAIIGNNVKGISKGEGAVAGAVVGGLMGNLYGRQEDRINAVQAQNNQTVINVQNSNGSNTPVVLYRSGNGWQGPRGEVYNNLPTVSQLQRVYGF